jgi:hypothetical protein
MHIVADVQEEESDASLLGPVLKQTIIYPFRFHLRRLSPRLAISWTVLTGNAKG